MKKALISTLIIAATSMLLISCGNDSKKENDVANKNEINENIDDNSDEASNNEASEDLNEAEDIEGEDESSSDVDNSEVEDSNEETNDTENGNENEVSDNTFVYGDNNTEGTYSKEDLSAIAGNYCTNYYSYELNFDETTTLNGKTLYNFKVNGGPPDNNITNYWIDDQGIIYKDQDGNIVAIN